MSKLKLFKRYEQNHSLSVCFVLAHLVDGKISNNKKWWLEFAGAGAAVLAGLLLRQRQSMVSVTAAVAAAASAGDHQDNGTAS